MSNEKSLDDLYSLVGQLTLNNLEITKNIIELQKTIIEMSGEMTQLLDEVKTMSRTLKGLEVR